MIECAVGQVTQILRDGLLINGNAKLRFNDNDSQDAYYRSIAVDTVVDYSAIRNENFTHCIYRCLWAKILPESDARHKTVRPQLREVIQQLQTVHQNIGGLHISVEDVTFTFLIDLPLVSAANIPPVENILAIANIAKADRMLLAATIQQDSGDSSDKEGQFEIIEPDLSMGSIRIPGLNHLNVKIRAKYRTPGEFVSSVILYFDQDMVQRRTLRIIAGNKAFIGKYGKCDKPANRQMIKKETVYRNMHATWNGPQIPNRSRTKPFSKIREWPVPVNITELLRLDPKDWDRLFDNQFEYLLSPLTSFNYTKWHDKLFLDEIALFSMLQMHNRCDVRLRKDAEPNCYSLPGQFHETRPSILPGDKFMCSRGRKKFDGIVVRTFTDRVVVLMDAGFAKNGNDNCAWDTTFKVCRTWYRLLHEVVDKRLTGIENDTWLFPTRELAVKQIPQLDVHLTTNCKMFVRYEDIVKDEHDDGSIVKGEATANIKEENGDSLPKNQFDVLFLRSDLNPTQKNAVRNVLRGEYRGVPYLISGPPGTGKTTVLVEIVFQLWNLIPNAKILLCTHSNSASELILRKLVETRQIQTGDVLRIISKQQYRRQDDIPDDLRAFCTALDENDDDDDEEKEGKAKKAKFAGKCEGIKSEMESSVQSKVNLATLMGTRILIGTCATIGYVKRMNFPTDHFTHLIIDEAVQLLEPELLVPLSLMENPHSQLVMAGDVKQLGPVLQWQALRDCGFALSLFERLLRTPGLYRPDNQWTEKNPLLFPVIEELHSELIHNYRSLPSILNLFNDNFYGGQLRSLLINPPLQKMALHTASLAMPTSKHRLMDHGVFFLSVVGANLSTPSTPSYYNPREAEVVLDVYYKLISLGFNPRDLAIISQYRGQVLFLRDQIALRGTQNARVSSVEEFQGQECAIVILSTVRSTTCLADLNQEYNFDFVKDPRRTNVALSRAQCMMVIVGNAPVLSSDPLWKRIIDYTAQRYAFFDKDEDMLRSIK